MVNALQQLTVAFAANLCGSSVANLLTVNALQQLTVAFAANLCGSSVANLLR